MDSKLCLRPGFAALIDYKKGKSRCFLSEVMRTGSCRAGETMPFNGDEVYLNRVSRGSVVAYFGTYPKTVGARINANNRENFLKLLEPVVEGLRGKHRVDITVWADTLQEAESYLPLFQREFTDLIVGFRGRRGSSSDYGKDSNLSGR